MFKKLKDKIAEEVKQSPLKIQASMQQLTQVRHTLIVIECFFFIIDYSTFF